MKNGSRGCKKKTGGCKKKQAQGARPRTHFIPVLAPSRAPGSVQPVSLAYVLKNKILQHETCSMLTHDSNDIKIVT